MRVGENWTASLLELIRRTSCEIPADVSAALAAAHENEAGFPRACRVLDALRASATLAAEAGTPLCQDTGSLAFFWHTPRGADHMLLAAASAEAAAEATRLGLLRRNTIETLSGRSVDTNVADGSPDHHFEQHEAAEVEVRLLLKGGGSENVGAQYALPDTALRAGRDLDGVRRCLLHAAWAAQGAGCAPGILGVCIGGDRAGGALHAKRQLLRLLPDRSAEPALAALEARVLREANTLGIGPMGTGGRTTLLGVKIAARSRLPACYFVSVAYVCWVCRRRGLRAAPDGRPLAWLD